MIVGFLRMLGTLLICGLAPLFVLSMVVMFGWLGYAFALSLFIVPWYIINRRRNRYHAESKNFQHSEKALEWIIREVKKHDVEA